MIGLDSWKTSEPDRSPSPGEHRAYDSDCNCDECCADREDDGRAERMAATFAWLRKHGFIVNAVNADKTEAA